MAESDSLEALQALQRDLIALSVSQLPTVERLWAELEAQVDQFRKLLSKPTKNDASRQKLSKGNRCYTLSYYTAITN
jgi:nuclear pore complex protein Nup205